MISAALRASSLAFHSPRLGSLPLHHRPLSSPFIARAALATQAQSTATASPVIGIRREDKNRWERRVALTPAHIRKLIKETGARVLVQPSNTRIFNNASFEKAGAVIEEDLSKADIILGIKEVPIDKMIPNKTYLVFSHTHKGQPYNMPSLQAFLDKSIRLIDYELMTDPATGKRLVLFGKHAGYAGMIDGLHGLGQRLLALGYNSPFIHMGQAHVYPNLECVNTKLRHVADIISDQGLPDAFAPMVFTFTGAGNVTQGARAIFDNLPHKNVTADELPFIARDRYNERYRTRLLALQIGAQDYLERIGGGSYDRAEYREFPDRYRSVFAQKIAPYTTMLINGIYWESKYPRLMTTRDLADIQRQRNLKHRMLAIADISCDIGGSLEFMSHASTIDAPFFYVDAVNGVEHKDIEKPGVQINSIDNLPTELPFEASKHFGNSLYPFAKSLASDKLAADPVLSKAIICENGALSKLHRHLEKDLLSVGEIRVADKRRKRVLLAGSGMVSQPLVDYLASSKDTDIKIASNDLDEARRIAYQFPNTEAALLDVSDTLGLDKLVRDSDVVVSLVPAPLHPQIAHSAIRNGKHVVTASYISPEMQKLNDQARAASVTVLNEIGLDPGIDHCSAMKLIDAAKARGSKIRSFISWCGGLTAPEDSNNQLGYKFSWSPRGVMTAGLNSAQFKINGQVRHILEKTLFENKFANVPLYPGFAFEGLANRDSLQYADIYGLKLDEMDTMFRGTLRYQGYSDILNCFLKLGFLDLDPKSAVDVQLPRKFLATVVGFDDGIPLNVDTIRKILRQRLGGIADPALLERFILACEEIDILPAEPSQLPSTNQRLKAPTALDAFSQLLQRSLKFEKEERDMVCMYHEFGIETPEGKYDVESSSLVVYGNNETGETAMARTVGVPAAIATRLLLEGKIQTKGVIRPTIPEIYNPLIERLEQTGLIFSEQAKQGIHNSLQHKMAWN
ncbi:hypothetical protein GGI26_004739 [Coemansia sp. RSA 1358]|nr:Saccharopine dehydrogenase-domain-containing protein [Coemansia spiralis]KAJ1990358.1 hypothetical protein EDC05_004122 [Coemansia umbellata]KAJ2620751.1 hypothetical protein GGI26_004739 [Coemansia sp. RSA 1358]